MMAEGLDQGSEQTGTRPLLPLLTRIPHALGLDVIPSFQVMNVVYAFTLYLFCALILDAYGADTRLKALIIGNLALCIATSKMFAFYAVQIDLGVLALVTAGFYFVMTDRHALAAAVAVLAMASREFGIVLVLCGSHRAFRRGRWRDAAWYLPGLAVGILVRRWTYSEGHPLGGRRPCEPEVLAQPGVRDGVCLLHSDRLWRNQRMPRASPSLVRSAPSSGT
jgi:hypothetical protein